MNIIKKIKRVLMLVLFVLSCLQINYIAYANETSENMNYDVSINVLSSWDKHYEGQITIKNTSQSVIENWHISFLSSDKIENIWNASIVTQESDTYSIKNAGWNQDIAPNQEVTFGFIASYEEKMDIPHDFIMAMICVPVSTPYEINYVVTGEWDEGLSGQLTISNQSDIAIEDWKIILGKR